MLSISYMQPTRENDYAREVQNLLNEHKAYIKYFNGKDYEEASQRIFVQAMEHPRSPDILLHYIKKLAKEIMKKSPKEKKEWVSNVYNDNGEINFAYLDLKEEMKIEDIEGSDEVYNALKDIYLMDSKAFMKLRVLHEYDSPKEITNLRLIREKNKTMSNHIRELMQKYGIREVSAVIQKFIEDIPCLTQQITTNIKTIEVKQKNKNVLEKLKERAVIEYTDERKGVQGLDENYLTKGEPDYNKWGIKGQSKFTILKIDISSYMDYIYREIFVEEGVNTKHITWCGDHYRLDTPAGEYYINIDRDKFITKVRIELITNLLHSNLHVLAVSEDNIYLKVKKAEFNTMRLVFKGKVLDLPVELYK